MRSKRSVFLLVVAFTLVAVVCLEGAPGLAKERVFRYIDDNPTLTTLDPHLLTMGCWLTKKGLLEGLVELDKDYKVVPAAAESWTVSKDGLTWTFHLRKDARWSNGDPVTAQDFAYSWFRVVDPLLQNSNWFFASPFKGVRNLIKYRAGEVDQSRVGIAALDKYTFQVTLETPNPDFLYGLTLPATFPVHRATVEKDGGEAFAGPRMVTNGPFKVESMKINDKFVFVRNPYYTRPRGNLDKVVVYHSPGGAAGQMVMAYKNGEVDFADVRLTDLQLVSKDKTLQKEVIALPSGVVSYISPLRSENPVLDDLRVRKALALAIDKEKIARVVLKDTWAPAYEYGTTPAIPGYDPAIGLRYDPAKARQLLAEAGYPGGKGFPEIKWMTGNVPGPFDLAVVDSWKQVLGLKVKIDNMEWGVYSPKRFIPHGKDYVGFWGSAMGNPTPSILNFAAPAYDQSMKMESVPSPKWIEWYWADKKLADEIVALTQQAQEKAKSDPTGARALRNRLDELTKERADADEALREKYASPAAREYARLIDQAMREQEAKRRLEIIHQALRVRSEDHLWVIPLFWQKNRVLVKPHVTGLIPSPWAGGSPLNFKSISVKN